MRRNFKKACSRGDSARRSDIEVEGTENRWGGCTLRNTSTRGIGLLYALAIGAVLVGLASLIATLTQQRAFQMQRTQSALQARLNARSGLNRFCLDHRLPQELLQCPVGQCEVIVRDGDIWFIGRCQGVERCLMAPKGNVRRVQEVTP